MKKFLIRALLFCLIFIIIDRCFILLRNYVPKLEADKRLEKILNKEIKSDILIFGASRGARDIIASQIEDSLKTSSFNLSYPGGDIEFQHFILKQIVGYYSPKLIVLTIDDNTEISKSENVTYRYDRLYPLVKYKIIRDELIRKKQKNKYLSELFIMHQLNKSNFDIRKKEFSEFEKQLKCGSMPSTRQTDQFKKKFSDSLRIYDIDKEIKYKKDYFLDFLKICNQSKIKVLLVFPPNFFKPSESFFQRIINLSQGKAICMKYDLNNPNYLSSSFFNDENHLQQNGAQIFTNEIIQVLKNNPNLYK